MVEPMKLKFVASYLLTLSILTGCGSLADNTDAPRGINIAGATDVVGEMAILVDSVPNGVTQTRITGISCKNKLWDSAPSDEAAIAVLRQQAAQAGYQSVSLVSTTPLDDPISINCWSAIEAVGIAF